MQRTHYYCDICNGEVAPQNVVIARMDEKFVDLCPHCKNLIYDYCRGLKAKFSEVEKP